MWQRCGRRMRKQQQSIVKDKLETMFAPLPSANRSAAPPFIVVGTLERPTYICEKILYQTRPGFFATGALWTPRHHKTGAKKASAPGVLMVSGHTPDGQSEICSMSL